MGTTIEELDQLWNKYDKKSMRAMGGGRPEEFFGAVRASLKHFFAQRQRLPHDSKLVIEKSWRLLDRAIEYHVERNEPLTEFAVELFEDIRDILLELIKIDLRIKREIYEDAVATDLKIRAAEKFGIKLPGRFYSRGGFWSRDNSNDLEAISYAQENIQEFANFLWDVGTRHKDVRNPIHDSGSAEHFSLYEKVTSLKPGHDLFPST